MPFDGKRMIFGGFEPVVEVKAWVAGATPPLDVPRITAGGSLGARFRGPARRLRVCSWVQPMPRTGASPSSPPMRPSLSKWSEAALWLAWVFFSGARCDGSAVPVGQISQRTLCRTRPHGRRQRQHCPHERSSGQRHHRCLDDSSVHMTVSCGRDHQRPESLEAV